MRHYTIEYHTQNTYEAVVKEGHFELMITPCNSEIQQLEKMEFNHSLQGQFFFSQSKYNFETLHIRTERAFTQFELKFRALVKKASNNINVWNGLSPEAESQLLTDTDFFIHHQPFLSPTVLTQLSSQHIPDDLQRQNHENIGTYLNRLNGQLVKHLQYQVGETTPQTTAQEALAKGKGVCQDFSHLMIGILRTQKIPARYVSGYLYGLQNHEEAQLHAWVEAWIPELGWKAFDPANQLMEDEHYIKIAHGRDYADCQPIKGVLKTQGNHQTNYTISVKTSFNDPFYTQQQQQQQNQIRRKQLC
ncbi:MAG: transglutaminase family protein [Microscillaceae bacterium]|jgi:hypothetical protein|nr:transglutaminase family protein [Microscillaceae bacterium]